GSAERGAGPAGVGRLLSSRSTWRTNRAWRLTWGRGVDQAAEQVVRRISTSIVVQCFQAASVPLVYLTIMGWWCVRVVPRGAGAASRRAGSALPDRADLVQVERPTGRTTWTRSARSGGLRCATGPRSRPGHPRVAEGPGRVAPAAGGHLRVVGPEALPAGGRFPKRAAWRQRGRAGSPSACVTAWLVAYRCWRRWALHWLTRWAESRTKKASISTPRRSWVDSCQLRGMISRASKRSPAAPQQAAADAQSRGRCTTRPNNLAGSVRRLRTKTTPASTITAPLPPRTSAIITAQDTSMAVTAPG
ncbi:hypothetical protein M2302_006014, partial [Micromonospora sp. A200]|nr:hypothetical protein [Micromonospora sp. A200]